MAPNMTRTYQARATKDLPIPRTAHYYALYQLWKVLESDFRLAGLGISSTFADHLSRINSDDPAVVTAEKKWLEAMLRYSHTLTEDQFRMKDPNIEHGSSQKTASQMIDPVDDVYPTAFEGPGKLAIPRMRPYRTAVLPHFPVTTANLPAADFGYTKEQIRHAIRIIMSVSPWDTFHDAAAKRTHTCIGPLHSGRPGFKIDQVFPDRTPNLICGRCDAEGFMISNFLLARNGFPGRSNTTTIPVAVLKSMASAFIKCPIKTPFEHILWAFSAQTFADNLMINGTEVQAWDFFVARKDFDQMEGWAPTTLTKDAQIAKDQRRIALAAQRDAAAAAAAGGGGSAA